jgi:hypothetical protein
VYLFDYNNLKRDEDAKQLNLLFDKNRFLLEQASNKIFFVVNKFDYYGTTQEAEKLAEAKKLMKEFLAIALSGFPSPTDGKDWFQDHQIHFISAKNGFWGRGFTNNSLTTQSIEEFNTEVVEKYYRYLDEDSKEAVVASFKQKLLSNSGILDLEKAMLDHLWKERHSIVINSSVNLLFGVIARLLDYTRVLLNSTDMSRDELETKIKTITTALEDVLKRSKQSCTASIKFVRKSLLDEVHKQNMQWMEKTMKDLENDMSGAKEASKSWSAALSNLKSFQLSRLDAQEYHKQIMNLEADTNRRIQSYLIGHKKTIEARLRDAYPVVVNQFQQEMLPIYQRAGELLEKEFRIVISAPATAFSFDIPLPAFTIDESQVIETKTVEAKKSVPTGKKARASCLGTGGARLFGFKAPQEKEVTTERIFNVKAYLTIWSSRLREIVDKIQSDFAPELDRVLAYLNTSIETSAQNHIRSFHGVLYSYAAEKDARTKKIALYNRMINTLESLDGKLEELQGSISLVEVSTYGEATTF